MGHRHEYETVYRPVVTDEASNLGIRAAELRKCTTCGKVMAFIETREGWFPLYKESEREEQGILMA